MIDPASIRVIRVHPGLGIARVGNAPGDDDFVFAAEIPGAMPGTPDKAFRDGEGRIRRQAVRFRLYAELDDGSVRELVPDDGVSCEWTVELANLKAGWYNFENAMDLAPEYAKPAARRNATLTGLQREQLDIRPGSRSIGGRSQSGAAYRFDSGQFFGKPVYLGEIRTDDAGRLLVLGGMGLGAPRVAGTAPTTFANNDEWHDDIADGPVHARVTFADGTVRDAEAGYVAVTPPNFAPGLFGIVTMLDVVDDLYARQARSPAIRPSFTRDIWPIFQRMTDAQWVNHGLLMLSGHGSPLDARNPAVLARLSSPDPGNRPFRHTVLRLFRDPMVALPVRATVPGIYSDHYDDVEALQGLGLALPPLMYQRLVAWADGEFDADWAGEPALPEFDRLPPAGQVAALDRAGLYECLGGPFHPGIELTWFMRVPSVWKEPYRINVLQREIAARQDYGDILTPQACLAPGGPLDGIGAGALTRSMGVPWQTDEASCLSDGEYAPSTYLSFPSFWGARVPNRVLSSEAWERTNSERSNPTQQLKNFLWRDDWLRDLKGSYLKRIGLMVTDWPELGILLPHGAGTGAQALGLPDVAWVETGRPAEVTGTNLKVHLLASIEGLAHPPPETVVLAEGAAAPYVPPRRRLRRDEV